MDKEKNMDVNTLFLHDILYLVFIILLIVLQVYLSKREDKISGLIVPTLSLLRLVTSLVRLRIREVPLMFMIQAFVVHIVPIIIYLTIYAVTRKRMKNKEDLEKMNIQDL